MNTPDKALSPSQATYRDVDEGMRRREDARLERDREARDRERQKTTPKQKETP
jgi:hypothetical protein